MTFYKTLLELIDLRSFSNLWYWIGLAVIWAGASHWVLGVPYGMVWRARRLGGQAQADLETMVRIRSARMLEMSRGHGPALVGLVCFLLTSLGLLGFAYGSEFAQALLFLVVPLCALGYLSLCAALRIEAGEGQGEALHRRLFWHRLSVQALGMVSILVTTLYGMYVNLLFLMAR